jgi:hypothetical protein
MEQWKDELEPSRPKSARAFTYHRPVPVIDYNISFEGSLFI